MARQDLKGIFDPKSVAVIGVSTRGSGLQVGGILFLETLLNYGFEGGLYPVNPKGGEICGLKIYPNIKDIPESVDYVICSIPAPKVPQLIQDCRAKGVKAIHIYTGGFSESGTEEGKQLEKKISTLARQNGIRLIGPNCMGIYCPEVSLSYFSDFPKESGSVALICQSGGNSVYMIREAARRGIRFSKVVSYGNACDVNESDLLEYLAADEGTKVIMAYIEGVRDGRRFAQVLSQCAKTKPIIVLKGGITEEGARAAASHTGALAGGALVWDRLLYQAGAIRVDSLEELVDMAVTFAYLRLPSGRKAAILGVGGGATVLAADDCISAGLMVPRFPREIQDKLRSYFPKGDTGVGLSNPVDLSDQLWGTIYDCAKIMLDYNGIDLLIYHLHVGGWPSFDPNKLDAGLVSANMEVIKAHHESSKPMAVAIHGANSPYTQDFAFRLEQKYCQAHLPVYHSPGNAAKAISRFIKYHERIRPNSLSS